MAYGIGRSHKLEIKNRKRLDNTKDSCDKLNENTDSNTTVVLPPHLDTYIQNQCNSVSDASVGENDVKSAGLYKSTNQHCNIDSKNNYDSQSYKTPCVKNSLS